MKQKLVEVFVDGRRDRRWLVAGYAVMICAMTGFVVLVR
jgi:hypothetical protein